MPLTPVIPRHPLRWHDSIEAIRTTARTANTGQGVYIVGGAVRDAYLHLTPHDLDLATSGDGCPLARHIADKFDGAFYPLDRERGVGRALIPWGDIQLTVDVAQFRGPDLLTDLQKRDFTVNAMAVSLTGDLQTVIDPLRGLSDLDARVLRQCSPDSIPSDPVRLLRAVRTSITYDLRIEPETHRTLRNVAPRLADVSPERTRDELIQILAGKRPAAALKVLHQLALLDPMLPEVEALIGIIQGPPHRFNVWQHTLLTVEFLDTILRIIAPTRSDNLTASAQTGLIAFTLDRFRPSLQRHLQHTWPNERPHRALLLLAALLHDSGKPATRSVDDNGSIRFFGHETTGETLAHSRAAELRLSNDETSRLATIVRHHMRPHWLHANRSLTPRAIYRFWRDTGPAGVDICLLAMADYLATVGPTLDPQRWHEYLKTIETLLDRYYLHHDTAVAPSPVITGQQLLDTFNLQPGPQIGRLLELVREAQAAGEVATQQEALDWVQRFLEHDE